MKISILTPDFSHNCFGRAWLLAKLLQHFYEIEVIGPAFGHGIWKPLENSCDFRIKIVQGYPNGRFEIRKMLKFISGDVIYASKPRMASFFVGLINKIKNRVPLVLDIDDWELVLGKGFYNTLSWYKKINYFRLSLFNWTSPYYVYVLDKLIPIADSITVSGSVLQAKYGGTIIRHARDINIFNPERYNRTFLRKKYLNIEGDEYFVVAFIGTPDQHKGLEDIFIALEHVQNKNLYFIIVGIDKTDFSKRIRKRIEDSFLKARTVLFSQQHFDILPHFYSIADLIVIPQQNGAFSGAQVPAKIFDAMAMAKPIISTNISDIPDILNDCAWIVPPSNPQKLADIIKYIINNPKEATEKGQKARLRCIQKYSWEIVRLDLKNVFEKYEMKMSSQK